MENNDAIWLNFYDKDVPHATKFEDKTLCDFLDEISEKFPKHYAFNYQGKRITFEEFSDYVNKTANALIDLGIKKEDRVAVILPNIIPCAIAYYAVLSVGAIAVMYNPLYTERELLYQFKDSGVKAVVTLDLLVERVQNIQNQTNVKNIIYASLGDFLPFPKNVLFPLIAKKKKLAKKIEAQANVYKFSDILKNTKAKKINIEKKLSDVAMFQYTGGTTGVPKGAVLTHKNLSYQIQQAVSWFYNFKKGEEKMLGALPFFHVFGLTASMNFGIFMAWENILIPKPHAAELLDAIDKFKPTFAPLVPTMYIGIINHPNVDKKDLSSIKGCFSGSAPLPVEVLKSFERKTGGIIVEGYGLTETSPITHINPFYGTRKIGSIGIPIPNTYAKIVNIETRKEAELGEKGELYIKGPQVMREYYNMPEENKKAFKDGWFATGDIAYMDEEGYFFIVDRKKDMVITGGLKIYPREVEEVLYEHEDILDACVVGIPHSQKGEVAKAFIVLKENRVLEEKNLLKYLEDKIAKYKIPYEIEFRNSLPKTNVGKVLKKDLR